MANDSVDKCNHKWMVLLFLVLSLASFIVPLHPSYHDQDQESTTLTHKQPKVKQKKPPKVEVACWTPSSYTFSHVVYANSFCANSFNRALSGEKDVNIYGFQDTYIPLYPFDPDNSMLSIPNVLKSYFDAKSRVEQTNKEREEVKGRVQKLVTFQTPIMLLVVAICLVLSQVVWCLLSECCSPFNVDQTLESAKMANSGDLSTRQSVYQDVSASLTRYVRSSPKTTSVLYLIKKVVSVLVAIALILVFCQHALPKVDTLHTDVNSLNGNAFHGTRNEDKHSNVTVSSQDLLKRVTDQPFLCGMEIRMLSDVQRYSLQCFVSKLEESNDSETIPVLPFEPEQMTNEKNLLDFECLLYHIALAFLVILAVANVLSLCSWILKLMTVSSKTSLGLSTNTAMDVVFLVQMARINAGLHVAHKLAQSFAGPDQEKLNDMPMDNQ